MLPLPAAMKAQSLNDIGDNKKIFSCICLVETGELEACKVLVLHKMRSVSSSVYITAFQSIFIFFKLKMGSQSERFW